MLQSEYKNQLDDLTKRYANHKRDFTASFYFNSIYLNFEEEFDLLIADNKEWLEYPQIVIEYYMDENNVIRKRSIDH